MLKFLIFYAIIKKNDGEIFSRLLSFIKGLLRYFRILMYPFNTVVLYRRNIKSQNRS